MSSAVEPDNETPWGRQPPTHQPPAPRPPAPRPPALQQGAAFSPPPPYVTAPPPRPTQVPHGRHGHPPSGYSRPAPGQHAPGQHAPGQHGPGGPIEPSSGIDIPLWGRRIFLASVAVLLCIVPLGALTVFSEKSWDPALEPYVAFVEAERGLEFSEAVDVRWANIAAELDADRPEETTNQDQSNPWSEAYHLLGLVDPDPEATLDQEVNDTLSENAGAFYEPWNETIVLPEGASDIELSVTIVHELTHALQHQHGMLGGGGLFESDDDFVARRALIEGDAERIALAWYWSQTDAFRADYLEAIGYDPDAEYPDPGDNYLAASFYASYEIGTPMVQAIVATEGVERINSLLRAKNVGTTDRLVDVLGENQFSRVDAIEEMTIPADSDGAVGDLGALTWFQVLAPIVGTEATFDALIGYDDDAFAVFESNGNTCARFSIFFENEREGAEFMGIIEAANLGGERDLLGNEATLDVCDPIGSPSNQRYGTILPLVVAHEAAVAHLDGGETVEVARCAAIAQASTVPADQALDDFVGWDTISDEMAQFLPDCK